MKKIFLVSLIITLLYSNYVFATEEKNENIKVRLYGHVYLEDKNKPLNNFKVYVDKNDQIFGEGKTNKEGEFDFVIDNKDEYLNLCIKSSELSDIKNIGYCVTVSAFQKIGRKVDGVEIREIEYTFFTNAAGENLNERLENEVSNEETEKAYQEYEDIKFGIQQEVETKEAQEKKKAELEEKKAEYHMVNNTEMIGPLDSIQVLGTVLYEGKDNKLDITRTFIRIIDHFGNILKEEPLSNLHDFNITVKAGDSKVFLHPLNLMVYNNQKQDINGNQVPLFKAEYRLITKEKNIVNIKLQDYEYNDFTDSYTNQREKFPVINVILLLGIFFSTIILVIKGKNYKIRNC